MTDEQLHLASMAKLRAKITPVLPGLGFVMDSELVLPFQRGGVSRPSMGGLRYVVDHPKILYVEIVHADAEFFRIYTIGKKAKPNKIKDLVLCRFEKIPEKLKDMLALGKKKAKK